MSKIRLNCYFSLQKRLKNQLNYNKNRLTDSTHSQERLFNNPHLSVENVNMVGQEALGCNLNHIQSKVY